MYALDNDRLQTIAPSIFATQAREDRSERYRFVPTIEVLDGLRSEGFFPVSVTESRSLTDDNRPFVKHHIRLRRADDIGIKLTEFDKVIPEIALTNSHDGTSGFVLDAALHRLVCKNGLIVANSAGSLRYRHTGSDLTGRIIEGAYEVVKDFPAIADSVQTWRGIQLEREEQVALAAAALPLRFDADEEGNYPVKPEKLLTPRRYGDRNPDLFTTYNVIQEAIIRGGVHAGYKNGRRQTTRKISSVDKDLKLNRALWTLTDQLAKIKQAA